MRLSSNEIESRNHCTQLIVKSPPQTLNSGFVPGTHYLLYFYFFFGSIKLIALPFQSCFREMAQDHLVPALTNWIIIKLPCFFLSFLIDWIILIQEKDSHHIGLLGIFFQNNTNFYTISLVSSFSKLFRKLISWV